MTEKLFADNFDKNYAEIKEKIKAAAEKSGRKYKNL